MNGESGLINYGFSGNYDTHLTKNTEWGAFTYLSQSKYGKYGNKNYVGENKVIYQNVSSSPSKSGCSWGEKVSTDDSTTLYGCPYAYNYIDKGTGASTTGTIYGIYDTVGPVSEYVMGNYKNSSGRSTKNTSNFIGLLAYDGTMYGTIAFPNRRYYNLYTDSIGIKGDATNADGTSKFYFNGSSSIFVGLDTCVWFTRGKRGYPTKQSSPFASDCYHGGWSSPSARFVMVTW